MANWTTALIGDVVFGTSGCRTGTVSVDLSAVTAPLGTVLTVPSATQITISTTTTAPQAAAGCIVIGQLQDTGMANITTAVNASTATCPSVGWSAGIYLISTIPGFLKSNPTSCTNNGLVQGQEFGGLGGYNVFGTGSNSTIVVVVPSLLPSACTNGSGNACFVVPLGAQWSNFRITGSGNAMSGRADAKIGVQVVGGYNSLRNMVFDQWGTGDTGFVGVSWGGGGGVGWWLESLVDAWGNIPVTAPGSGPNFLVVRNLLVQNSCGSSLFSATSFNISSQGGFVIQLPNVCSTSPNRSMLSLASGSTYTSGSQDIIQMSDSGVNSNGILIDSTSTAYLGSGYLVKNQQGSGGFAIHSTGGIVHACGATIQGGVGTAVIQAPGSFFDDCVNTVTGSTKISGGTVFGNASAVGVVPATGNFALTNATFTSATGTDQRHFTLNITASAAAAITIVYTFPTAFNVAPGSCKAQDVGGTNPLLTFSTSVAQTTTAVTFLSSAAAVNTDTVQVAIDCN